MNEFVKSPMHARPLETINQPQAGKYIPLPNVIKRHILQPSQGKVVGFRIEVKGRTGSRSARRCLAYGSLASGKVGMFGSFVDFGKSSYVTKRGVSGVKVWVQYK